MKAPIPAKAKEMLSLPKILSSGMVLQRNVPLKIWGGAIAGNQITIRIASVEKQSEADAEGEWEITLPEMDAGGPYTMEIEAGSKIRLDDIMIGDVWMCAGQSNMQLPIARVRDNYAELLENCGNKNIRQFIVPMIYNFDKPQANTGDSLWEHACSDTIDRFTATGYFFAKELNKLYNIPIGLINTAIGGSPAESWLSEEALAEYPDYLAAAKKYSDETYRENITSREERASNIWYGRVDYEDQGLKSVPAWYDANNDPTGWKTTVIPSSFEEMGLKEFNGSVWFRKKIDVPTEVAGLPARLWLGRIVNSDFCYVNGQLVGSVSYQYPPRKYDIPAGLLKPGRNVIVSRVISRQGIGGFIKEKPYQLFCSNKTIDLTGEWQYRIGVEAEPLGETTFFQYKPLGLYNGMIAPVIRYAIKGVIWYQGESNTDYPFDYQKLFSSLIDDWRNKWHNKSLPFLYVQLPNYCEEEKVFTWPLIRQAQLKTLAKPGTAMAVAIDLGEWNDLHPLNKQGVGERLALAARKVAYGETGLVHMGPIYQSSKIEGNRIRIHFTQIGSGLTAKDSGELKWFEIKGDNSEFISAQAKIEGDSVVVWNDKIQKPAAARYAWADNPVDVNLYNAQELPASPFTTEY